jgi:ABC-type transporter MlaC component
LSGAWERPWVRKENGKQLIYGVSIESVSLGYNYRTQLADILSRSSYDKLNEKLKERVEAEKGSGT